MGGKICAALQQAAVANGLKNVRAQRRDGLLDRGAACDPSRDLGSELDRQFIPQPLVAPVFDPLGQWHIDIVAAAAAFVVGIDQFVMALRRGCLASRTDRRARNQARIETPNLPVHGTDDRWRIAIDVVESHVARMRSSTGLSLRGSGEQPMLEWPAATDRGSRRNRR